ncbi:MAG TPA: hypothetical protein VGZ22_12175 [Isosphaeraceae bacterium]|jgi:hypothetical protein|nr:hypothetical protein [Isosphaeraceae bacterium]
MRPGVKFSVSAPGADRVHHINEEDVRIVLSRMPLELWRRLRAVHFNDRARGSRVAGYVTRGLREIALCALPPRIGLTSALRMAQTPERFGARRGQKWPTLAIRRFLLYDVFLHELGHLQVINHQARSDRLKFAREKLAEEFAVAWCDRLWSAPFAHPDPVHNPPTAEELDALNHPPGLSEPSVFAQIKS